MLADFVDQDVFCDVAQRHFVLEPASPCRRNRDDVFAFPPVGQFLAGRLTVAVQFEMPFRPIERGIDDRTVGKCHASAPKPTQLERA